MQRSNNSKTASSDSGRQRRGSLKRLVVALITTTLLTLWVSGCCSPQVSTSPPLPAGKPQQTTVADLAHRLTRHQPLPGPDGRVPRDITIPRALLIDILGHLDEWRAWALALEEAGEWRK
jgi:hypothetical protein